MCPYPYLYPITNIYPYPPPLVATPAPSLICTPALLLTNYVPLPHHEYVSHHLLCRLAKEVDVVYFHEVHAVNEWRDRMMAHNNYGKGTSMR